MDPKRIPELMGLIQRAVQETIPDRICLFDEDVSGSRNEYSLSVGQDKVRILVQEVGGGILSRLSVETDRPIKIRHYLSLRTPSLEGRSKVIRETRVGWFTIGTIVASIVQLLDLEARARQNAVRVRQLYQTAQQAVDRLKRKKLPENLTLAISKTPGSLVIQIDGVSEKVAAEIISNVRHYTRETGERALWDHLIDDS